MNGIVRQVYESILNFDRGVIGKKVQEALDAGIDPQAILSDGMIAAMGEVGRRFEEGEFFIPEMLIAATTMETGLAVLQPHLTQQGVKSAGRILIGTVKGDLHDVGKNLVAMMLRGSGFEVIDLGVDIAPERFVEEALSKKPQVIAMSALLTTTMPSMNTTIQALKEAGLRSKVKVIIGGAPLSDSYAKEIGADGYAPDANRAVKVARSLLA
ncbi:MAG: corrinoid protein [Dehalococcoidia bacterium]|nr:corrinoid protein [Dehalococcoidia bacterium]